MKKLFWLIIAVLQCTLAITQTTQIQADQLALEYVNQLTSTNNPLTNNNNVSQYIINPEETTKTINVSNFTSGQYAVILVCNGVINDHKTIIIMN